MRVLLFGTGDYYRRYRHWFDSPTFEVLALLDNEVSRQGKQLNGCEIVSPAKAQNYLYDRIYILTVAIDAIRNQLVELGVPQEKIYSFYDMQADFGRIFHSAEIIRCHTTEATHIRKTGKKRIALVANSLNLNGADLALYYAATVLQKTYEVTILSPMDGALRKSVEDARLELWIDPNLQIAALRDMSWQKDYDLIFVNTIHFYRCLSKRDVSVPVLWWLHDGAICYKGIALEELRAIDAENFHIYGASPLAVQEMQARRHDVSVGTLLFGVSEEGRLREVRAKERGRKKLSLCVVGGVQYHKGQDLLLQAVTLLPERVAQCIMLHIIGTDQSPFAEDLKRKYGTMSNVRWHGECSREVLHRIYLEMDVMVCPSRTDTMSIAVIEAMQYGIASIVSKAAGITAYMEDGVQGLTYEVEDVKMLADHITWVAEHETDWRSMGSAARAVYDTHFSMPAFEMRLLAVTKNILGA